MFFTKTNALWITDFDSVVEKNEIPTHHSTKIATTHAPMKKNEKLLYPTLQEVRQKRKAKYKVGILVKTADFDRTFNKEGTTHWFRKRLAIIKMIRETIASNQKNELS